MTYLAELVHADDGSIDTLEQITLDPFHGYSPIPGLMTVTNGNLIARDVYLRVVAGGFLGVHVEDSTVTFRDESIYNGGYPIDTSYSMTAYKSSLPSSAPLLGHLALSSIFPNPLLVGASIHAFVAYPAHHPIEVAITDQLGRDVITRQHYQSTGDWQPIDVATNEISGAYFITVRAGNESRTVPLSILR